MHASRRELITQALGMAGLGLLPRPWLCAADIQFATDPFTLGIASGYPEPNALVLWTRLAPEPLAPGAGMPSEPVPVAWELAEDERFGQVLRRGQTYATADWAHSVHVEVNGLEPGREYWYRFTSGGMQSPAGRARTAPAAGARTLKIGIANCQHYESGFYAAYDAMAREDFDLVLHLGDYIYELRGVPEGVGARSHDLPECYTLDDYRRRYALYKSDPMLQAAHASCAWMLASDDHEVDNDYAGARSEQNDTAELFLARRAAAYQAYYEHQPLPRRMLPFGPHQRLHTRRSFGGLAEIHMLDGRQYRSDQACGGRLVAPCEALFDERRSMLGTAQEQWLHAGLTNSNAQWQLLAQQTVFARMDQSPGPEVGFWADGWSGYPAARQRLLDVIAARDVANPVVLSGDIHAFLANDIHAEAGNPDSRLLATELVTSSISSNGPPQAGVDLWKPENPNVHLARSDVRGYTRLRIARDAMHADFIGLDDPRRADSATYVLASFDIVDREPGIVG